MISSLRRGVVVLPLEALVAQRQSPAGELRGELVQMRVTSDERAHLQRLAKERGPTLSDLMRQAVASHTATDAARPDVHLGVALERLYRDTGLLPEATVRFLEGLAGLMRRTEDAGRAKGSRRRR